MKGSQQTPNPLLVQYMSSLPVDGANREQEALKQAALIKILKREYPQTYAALEAMQEDVSWEKFSDPNSSLRTIFEIIGFRNIEMTPDGEVVGVATSDTLAGKAVAESVGLLSAEEGYNDPKKIIPKPSKFVNMVFGENANLRNLLLTFKAESEAKEMKGEYPMTDAEAVVVSQLNATLGGLYAHGIIVDKNPQEALKHSAKANPRDFAQKYSDAFTDTSRVNAEVKFFGELQNSDHEQVFADYEDAALNKGDKKAAIALGYIYTYGSELLGVEPNPELAMQFFQRAGVEELSAEQKRLYSRVNTELRQMPNADLSLKVFSTISSAISDVRSGSEKSLTPEEQGAKLNTIFSQLEQDFPKTHQAIVKLSTADGITKEDVMRALGLETATIGLDGKMSSSPSSRSDSIAKSLGLFEENGIGDAKFDLQDVLPKIPQGSRLTSNVQKHSGFRNVLESIIEETSEKGFSPLCKHLGLMSASYVANGVGGMPKDENLVRTQCGKFDPVIGARISLASGDQETAKETVERLCAAGDKESAIVAGYLLTNGVAGKIEPDRELGRKYLREGGEQLIEEVNKLSQVETKKESPFIIVRLLSQLLDAIIGLFSDKGKVAEKQTAKEAKVLAVRDSLIKAGEPAVNNSAKVRNEEGSKGNSAEDHHSRVVEDILKHHAEHADPVQEILAEHSKPHSFRDILAQEEKNAQEEKKGSDHSQ
jgi:hypothetical protein